MRTTFSRLFAPKDAGSHHHHCGTLTRSKTFRSFLLRTKPNPFAVEQSIPSARLVTMTQHATRNTQHAPPSRGATGFGVGGMAVARRRQSTSIVGL